MFNQFLVLGDEPLPFHTGLRRMFPLVSVAMARIMPVERLRWISFGHYEADECGAMNEWLAAALRAQVAHGMPGCMVVAGGHGQPAPARAGGRRGDRHRRQAGPLHRHAARPHDWDAGVLYEETTRTLFCGDLFTHFGNGPAVTQADVAGPALETEDVFRASSIVLTTAPTIRRLADLAPATLAVMHGSSFAGDAGAALRSLADGYKARLRAGLEAAAG